MGQAVHWGQGHPSGGGIQITAIPNVNVLRPRASPGHDLGFLEALIPPIRAAFQSKAVLRSYRTGLLCELHELLSLDEGVHRDHQLHARKRFGYVVIGSKRVAMHHMLILALCRQHNHGHGRGVLICPESL